MAATTTSAGPSQAAGPTRTLLIDTDVHEGIRSGDELKPYLDEYYHPAIEPHLLRSNYAIPHSGSRAEWIDQTGRVAADRDKLARHLFDEEHVTTAILCGFLHVSAAKASFDGARAVATAYNNWQIDHWLNYDNRLRGSVHVVADDPHQGADEIDRVAQHPQIVQVFLPLVTDRQYGDPRYRPIFEAAVRNKLPVTFHHGGHTQTVLGYPRYWIEWHTFAAPQAAQNQLMSLICNGTFDKYPELMVVLLETGVTWLPWFMWRADQQYRELRREVPWVKRLPSEHMRDNVRVATQPMGDVPPPRFAQLVEMTGTERLFVFATDYPHYDADSADTTLPASLGELGERVRYKNAIETFPRLNANGLNARAVEAPPA